MFGHYSVTSILLAFTILLMPAVMSGCSGNKSGQQQDVQLQAARKKIKEEKESEKLSKLEDNIETLFEALGGPAMKTEGKDNKPGQQDKDNKENDQQDGTQQEDGQDQDKQQEKGQQQGNGQKSGQQEDNRQESKQQKDEQKEKDAWMKADKAINDLHYKWNDLLPEVTKKGADLKLVDAFDNSLNNLTTEAESRNKDKVLALANKLYSHIPDLYSLYHSKIPPEVKRMIYFTRNVMLESEKDNWEQVERDTESLEKTWTLFRNTVEDEQKKTGDKLNFSIYELKKVVSEKNRQLADIKGRIVLNNIGELSKLYEEK